MPEIADLRCLSHEFRHEARQRFGPVAGAPGEADEVDRRRKAAEARPGVWENGFAMLAEGVGYPPRGRACGETEREDSADRGSGDEIEALRKPDARRPKDRESKSACPKPRPLPRTVGVPRYDVKPGGPPCPRRSTANARLWRRADPGQKIGDFRLRSTPAEASGSRCVSFSAWRDRNPPFRFRPISVFWPADAAVRMKSLSAIGRRRDQ